MYFLRCYPPLNQFDFDLAYFHQDPNITIHSANHQHCFDSVCHLFVTLAVLSGLCSSVSTLLRDHLMRLSPLLLRWGVLKRWSFMFWHYFIGFIFRLTVHCSVYKKKEKRTAWACFVRPHCFEFYFPWFILLSFEEALLCTVEYAFLLSIE